MRAFCATVGLPTTLAEIGLADLDDGTLALIAAGAVAEARPRTTSPSR